MKVIILVATHKPYWMPEDNVYLPLHVGKKQNIGFGVAGDDTGDNISHKNDNYCELTGMYWAWKNLECDIIGLCHYRRYFANKKFIGGIEAKKRAILKKQDFINLLQRYDVVLPKKRNYYIESVRSQYEHAHTKHDLDVVEQIIKEKYPNYINAFTKVMQSTRLHIFNMFVMPKELFDEYCEWLFDILFELEKRIDISGYNQYEARVFGFLSERLFNVWLENHNFKIKELEVVNLEDIDWIKKMFAFLKRKFFGK